MGRGARRRQRKILPIGQDVDGDEIDRVLQVGIAQPELPDVRIGDRLGDLGFDLADDGAEIGRRHFAAQQHLVADDHRPDDVRILFGKRHGGGHLRPVVRDAVGQPQPLQDFEPIALGDFRNLIEAVLDRIGADAIGVARQEFQILVDLLRRNLGGFDQADSGRRGTAHRRRNRAFRRPRAVTAAAPPACPATTRRRRLPARLTQKTQAVGRLGCGPCLSH